jgi:hypothetical protein
VVVSVCACSPCRACSSWIIGRMVAGALSTLLGRIEGSRAMVLADLTRPLSNLRLEVQLLLGK